MKHAPVIADAGAVLEGSGTVTIDGAATDVAAGTTVFIPGSAIHSIEAAGDAGLRFAYVLDADAFEDVNYVFANGQQPADGSS